MRYQVTLTGVLLLGSLSAQLFGQASATGAVNGTITDLGTAAFLTTIGSTRWCPAASSSFHSAKASGGCPAVLDRIYWAGGN